MRVAFALDSYTFGGVEEHVALLAEALPRYGVTPIVVCAGLPGLAPLLQRLDAAGVERVEIDYRAGGLTKFTGLHQLRRFLAEFRVDLIHVQLISTSGGRLPMLAARLSRVPTIATHHLAPHAPPPRSRRLVRAPYLRSVDTFIAVSESNRVRQIAHMGLAAEKVVTIYNGIPLPPPIDAACRRSARKRLRFIMGVSEDAPVIGMVGRLYDQKGHTYLLQALPALHARFPELRVGIVGDGDLWEPLRAEAEARGVASLISWLGFRSDVEVLMPGFDALAMPSDYEGLPFVLLEAMAAEVPLVASRVDGIPEAVRDGMEGVLIERGDVGALTAGLASLLESPERGRVLGAAARARLAPLFTIETMVEKTVALYREVIERSR
jgi:glycosyltransferase involved in cell wall biosynthesis